MRWSGLVLACTLAACAEGALLRGHAESLEVSSDWAALSEAESEDRNFLLGQLDDTESELVQLQQFIEASSGKASMLEISATPIDKKAKPAVKEEAKKEAKAPDAKEEEDPAKIMASLGLPHLLSGGGKGMKGQAALAPMLAMLKGLYQDSKERITQQNTREEKSKKWFTEKEAEHKGKLESIEAKFNNHTLSEEFRTNETRDENRYFNYWERVRQRQHRQFHTNLKIQHAMMTKVKKMVDMYEKALSPKAEDQKAAKKQLGQMTGMPEIVFLQDAVRTVGKFCRESLAEVRKEKAELQEPLSF